MGLSPNLSEPVQISPLTLKKTNRWMKRGSSSSISSSLTRIYYVHTMSIIANMNR
jgi:hypothetical protein